MRRDSSWLCGAGRSSAALSWHRSVPRSPKCARSPSTHRRGGRASGRCSSRNCSVARSREGFDKLCAFTHAPGYFMPMGFSIVPHLWIPEKIFTDCVKCPQFRRCGQYAMVLPLDSIADRSIATFRSWSRVTYERSVRPDPRDDRRRRHDAARVSCRRHQRGHQGRSRRAGPGVDRLGPSRDGGGGVHDQSRRRRRRFSSHAITWRGRAAWRAPSSSTAGAPMPAPATRACRPRTAWRSRPPPGSVARSSRCSWPRPASSGSRCGSTGSARRCRRRFTALGADQGSLAARAIMTTDPFPKEAAARVSVGGRDITVGGMAKGSGMIEPMMATMLGFVTTDAAVPPALLDRALREVVDDTFNAITVDGECSTNDCVMLLANGASGVTVDDAQLPGLRRRAANGVPAAGAGHRAWRRRRDKARDRDGHRRGVGGRGAACRQSHRELAAREDGHSRRRSELGSIDRRRRPGRRRVRAESREGGDWTDRACSRTARPTTRQRRKPHAI